MSRNCSKATQSSGYSQWRWFQSLPRRSVIPELKHTTPLSHARRHCQINAWCRDDETTEGNLILYRLMHTLELVTPNGTQLSSETTVGDIIDEQALP